MIDKIVEFINMYFETIVVIVGIVLIITEIIGWFN